MWYEQWRGMSILEVFMVEPQQSCVSHNTEGLGPSGLLLLQTTIIWSKLLKYQVAVPHFA